MADGDYNSMQAQAGIMPPMAMPQLQFPAQVSAQIAQQGMAQLQSMSIVSQMRPPMAGPFGFPSFPQSQMSFTGMPPMVPGMGGIMTPMMPAAPPSPFMGAGYGMGGFPQQPPGNIYQAGMPATPPPMYRGPMGMGANTGMFGLNISPPSPMFQTPYQMAVSQQEATYGQGVSMTPAAAGMAGRFGANLAGAGAGYALGRRFGMGGIGAIAGFAAAEFGGLGQMGQNLFAENVGGPIANLQTRAMGLQRATRSFVSGGENLDVSGAGLNRQSSIHLSRLLDDMASSKSFQRETGGRFNTQDVSRLFQASSQEGLMQGTQNPQDMTNRVRDVARSVRSFMELANEPDLRRAIQVMGQMRTSGLNLQETVQAVQHGRAFARMAGTTFETLANVGGAMGAGTFQSMGLTQGLGMRTGMANLGIATASQNAQTLSPQMMNLVGGPQGLANLNNMFSAGTLQMPMLAPAMMTGRGGMNVQNMQALMAGRLDPMQMTAMGSGAMGGMARQMGPAGLGMAMGMQPMMQDLIGRTVQAQGPFAQRNMEDRMVMQLSQRMGMRGSEGFMTAAQIMGMTGPQATARAMEMGDPRYFQRMRGQVETQRRERRAEEVREQEETRPGFMDELAERSTAVFGARSAYRGAGRRVRGGMEWLAGGATERFFQPTRNEERQYREFLGGRGYEEYAARQQRTPRPEMQQLNVVDRLAMNYRLAQTQGAAGLVAGIGAVGYTAMGALGADFTREYRDAARGGQFASGVVNATPQEQVAATRQGNVQRLFGGQEGMMRFAGQIGQAYSRPREVMGGYGMGLAANAAVMGGSEVLTRGLFGLGPITQTAAPNIQEIRQRFVAERQRQGMSSAQASQLFEENQGSIATAASQSILERMSPVAFARAQEQAANVSIFGARGGVRDYEQDEQRAYRRVMRAGADSAEQRRQVDRLFQFTGTGRGQQREDSRNYQSMLTTLRLQLGSPRNAEARLRIDELQREGARRGLDTTRLGQETNSRVATLMRDPQAIEAAQQVDFGRTGGEMFDRAKGFRQEQMGTRAGRMLEGGYQVLARQEGILGDVFRGAVRGGRVDEGAITQQLTSIGTDEERMAQLQIANPRMAAIAQRMATGTEEQRQSAMRELRVQVGGFGEQSQQMRARYRELGAVGRWRRARGIGQGIMDVFRSEESWAAEQMGGGTRADRDALRQTGDINQMQAEAEGQGMGGAADALLEASQSLNEAARAISGAAGSGMMDRLLSENPVHAQ